MRTLEDYFGDVKVWLPGYFFSKFVAEIIGLIATQYVRAIRKRSHATKSSGALGSFANPLSVAAKLLSDHQHIEDFFLRYETHLRGTTVAEELGCVKDVVSLISCAHPSGVKTQIVNVLGRWVGMKMGAEGLEVVQAALTSKVALSREEKSEARLYASEQYSALKTQLESGAEGGGQMVKQSTDDMIRAYNEPQRSGKKQGRRLSVNLNMFRGGQGAKG